MSNSETVTYIAEDRLGQALAEYEMALDEGCPLDRQAFLARHADIAGELAPLLEVGDRFDALARPLRQALAGDLSLPVLELEGYQILKEIAHGGMGVIYEARQKGTEAIVALKMPRLDWLNSLDEKSRVEAIAQFRREVQAAARLRHPNRVRILHQGEHQGIPFYAMELIRGCSLAKKLQQPEGISKEDALKYLAAVAEAVQEAHERKILHRDLKPHNILIDDNSKEALLTDFGLALLQEPIAKKEGSEADSVRAEARLAGTLPYMSPEAIVNSDDVTNSSDVYSLGATLYEVLIGTPPFQGQSRMELLEKICHANPVPLRQHRPDISPRIEQICLKCLHKDPARRYPSALALAQALRRYLDQVRYGRNFTGGSHLFIWMGPLVFLSNLMAFLLMQINFFEPVIWLVIFSMYVPLFAAFWLAPGKKPGEEHFLSRREMLNIWGGKLLAAVCISIALRMTPLEQPKMAFLLIYPVFAALSGMALFATVPRMPRWQLGLAIAFCLGAILMVFLLPWAPILYGLFSMVGAMMYGFFLQRLGLELK